MINFDYYFPFFLLLYGLVLLSGIIATPHLKRLKSIDKKDDLRPKENEEYHSCLKTRRFKTALISSDTGADTRAGAGVNATNAKNTDQFSYMASYSKKILHKRKWAFLCLIIGLLWSFQNLLLYYSPLSL